MTPAEENLAIKLYEIGAIQFGEFEFKLHEKKPKDPRSPIRLNIRTPDNPNPGKLNPEILADIGKVLYSKTLALGLEYDHVVGVPNAGTPLALAFKEQAVDREISVLTMEKIKAHGRRWIGTIISGSYSPGDRILLIDDLITEGDSKLEAIKALEEKGLKVLGVLVLVDREQGGVERLKKAGYEVYAPLKLLEMVAVYRFVTKVITEEQANEVIRYISSNRF